MKIFTSLTVLSIGFTTLCAQPTINRNDLFAPGDVLFAVEALEIPDVSPSGANATWDFSDLQVDTPNIVAVYIAASDTTPYAADYPTSDLVQTLGFGGLTYYQFMESDADGISIVGEVIPGFVPGQSVYSDPELIVAFPLTYQSTWTDDFAYDLSYVGSGVTYEGDGNTMCEVDGYGTLVLPHLTFEDVLRLKMITFSFDTASFGSETETIKVFDTTYVWLSPAYHGPLCSYTTSRTVNTAYFITQDTVISDSVTVLDSSFSFDPFSEMTSSVVTVSSGKYSLSISPNPFENILQLSFSTERSQELQFILRDIHGREVYAEDLGIQTGDTNIQLSLPSLPGGMYVALLQSATGADVQKLIRLSR